MTTAVRRSPRAMWAAARGPLAVAALILLAGVLIGAFADRATRGSLDPAAVDDAGSRAVAELLRDEGLTVDLARTAADLGTAGADATVLVPFPRRLDSVQVDALRDTEADLVLVAPGAEVLARLTPRITSSAYGETVRLREPGCTLPAAVVAGNAEIGGELYVGDATRCYDGALAQLDDRGRTITVLGSGDVLTNGALAEAGNAALAMRLLGQHPHLVWFLALPEEAPVQQSFEDLIPVGWSWATAGLVVAALLAVAWRGRRLGRVVVEPLPVVIRAAETVEGRARLYQRSRDRGHVTDVLRRRTRARLATLVGLPAGVGEAELVAAVARRTGRAPTQVGALLYGPAPVDDAAMIAVAGALDACEREVRRA